MNRELKQQYPENNQKVSFTAPYAMKIEVTYMCNYNCDFCYNQNSTDIRNIELSTEKLVGILDKIQSENIKNIRITGGEPFVHNDIMTVLQYAKEKGLYVKVNSNGSLLDKKKISSLKNYVDCFLFSFHSIADDELNHLRKIIEVSLSNGIEVNLNTIANSNTILNIGRFFKAIKTYPIRWILQRPVPNINMKYPISNNDIKILIEKLLHIYEKYNQKPDINGLPFCSFVPDLVKIFSKGSQNCGIMNQLVINPDGLVRPCYSINESLGSIFEDDICSMWNKGLSYDIRSFNNFPNICTKCKYLESCLGGCRFAAKLINGTYDALDPLAKVEEYKEFLF